MPETTEKKSDNQETLEKTSTITVDIDDQSSIVEKLRKKPLLDVKEVQQILGIGRTSTYAFIKDNPPFRVIHINTAIRIPSSDLFRWLIGDAGRDSQ